jgi:hypothetical protein
VNEKSQREKAEEWLEQRTARFPHVDVESQVRVMNPQCQEMFDTTLAHAKDPKYNLIAWSLIERAKGIVDALMMHDQLDWDTYKAYRAQISAVGLIVSAAEFNTTA